MATDVEVVIGAGDGVLLRWRDEQGERQETDFGPEGLVAYRAAFAAAQALCASWGSDELGVEVAERSD